MKWKTLTLKVQILSPVAIGTGERCNQMGFVADGKTVLVVDEHRLIASLSDQQQQLFLHWIEPLADRLSHLRE